MFAAMREAGEPAPGGRALALLGDAHRLPFPDGAFDAVILSEVLEHIPDDRHAIAEVARILRPGGTLAVTVPRWWPERVCWALSDAYHQVEGGHVRIYRRRELLSRLRAAALVPMGSHHAHALHSPYWWMRCLFGIENEAAVLPRLYHRLPRLRHHAPTLVDPDRRTPAQPGSRQEPRHLPRARQTRAGGMRGGAEALARR